MTTDFSRLYSELGLHPGCTLRALSSAYRRRISELHPDHHPAGRPHSAGTMDLADLISLYNRALQFHREYGRLPGAVHAPRMVRTAIPEGHSDHARTRTAGGSHWRLWLIAAVLAVLGLELLASSQAPAPEQDASIAAMPPVYPPDEPPTAPLAMVDEFPSMLEIGMDSATVRALQGEPVKISDGIWEYGPSWIRIERGHVTDWYSSPLYRLKTRTPTPEADAE